MATDFDFNDELSKLIKSQPDEPECTAPEQMCLISREKLDDTHIVLLCGHRFNYTPIFEEVKRQKLHSQTNNLEVTRLQQHQIKCPYCRNVQDKVLPYPLFMSVERLPGVNSPSKWQMLNDKCTYVNNNKRSKYFQKQCSAPCWGQHCKKHYRNAVSKAGEGMSDVVKCCSILKSGSRKGEQCNVFAYKGGYCKRHFNLLDK